MVLVPDAPNDRRAARRRAAPAPTAASDRACWRLVPEVRRRGDRQHARRSARPRRSSRWSSMNATITSVGGRAPPGRNTRTPSAGSRWRASARRLSRSSSFSRCALVGRQAGALAGIALGLAHPPPQRLGRAAELLGRSTRSPPTATDARRRARGTIRTARSRTSGEYLLGRAMGSILSTNGPSDETGTVHRERSGSAALLGRELRPRIRFQESARRTPEGAHGDALLPGISALPNQDFCGAPSTQVLTLRIGPSISKMNPCTISPLHLGHRLAPALICEPLVTPTES